MAWFKDLDTHMVTRLILLYSDVSFHRENGNFPSKIKWSMITQSLHLGKALKLVN